MILSFMNHVYCIQYDDVDKEIFIDRNPKYFNICLDNFGLIRKGKDNFKAPRFNQENMEELN